MFVPVIWCLVGASAAFLSSMPADAALVIAGVVLAVHAIVRNRAVPRSA
ncbi:MAG TPA: hypothetical protein VH601_25695 [Bryobacteraceae bacterium]|jgi:hypothetical protein